MEGEYDAFTEEVLPPPSTIDNPPVDAEPGIRREMQVLEAELDLLERETPDAPRRRSEQPQPRADRAEDLMRPRSTTPGGRLGMPSVLEWTDDGAWDDSFGLDVAEGFR